MTYRAQQDAGVRSHIPEPLDIDKNREKCRTSYYKESQGDYLSYVFHLSKTYCLSGEYKKVTTIWVFSNPWNGFT